MELKELEQLALSPDRAAAVAALLPGTTEHDYWRGVLLQHEGRLDDVDAILRSWEERHQDLDDHYERLRRRQLLARAQRDLPAAAEQLIEETNPSLDDRAEVVVQAQRFPTRLDPAVIDERNVLQEAIRRRGNLDDVTDIVIPEIVRNPTLLSNYGALGRIIVQRLQRVDLPRVVEILGSDLIDKDGANGRFGARPVHGQLTLAQLFALAEINGSIRAQSAWVEAVLTRMAPPVWVDLRTDRDERARVLEEAQAFADTLVPTFNTLKATLLYHRLELDRAANIYDRARFRAYLALPRNASWTRHGRNDSVAQDRLVQPNAPAAASLGLDPIGNDEPLVRDFLARFLLEDDPATWSDLLEATWLWQIAATSRLLAGVTGAEAERCAKVLGTTEREALKSRVDIDLAPQNPRWFAADADVVLDVDVKNVRELEVKVFRIDALAYWLTKSAEVDTTIDLDGMVPSGPEKKLVFDAAPMRRHREQLALPECKRPGTYVVELIGNGRSSRALIRKGALRHLVRTTAAGVIVTITDEDGHVLPAAKLWLGGRALAPRDPVKGSGITIPFGNNETATVLLVHGDVVQRASITRPPEHIQLAANFQVEREALVANQTAKVLACPRLTIGGAAASLALLSEARVDIAVSLLDGTSSSRSQPVVLHDEEDLVLDVPIPDGTTRLVFSLHAKIRSVSRQETIETSDTSSGPLNVIHTSEATSLVHLARVRGESDADRFILSFLGKTGEPLAGRAVALTLKHRAIHTLLQLTLETDDKGNIDLGALDGKVTQLSLTLPSGHIRSWDIARVEPRSATLVHALEGEPIVLARNTATRTIADLTLMAIRRGTNVADYSQRLVLVDRCVSLDGLPPGEYRLDFPYGAGRASTFLIVAPRATGLRTAASTGAAARSWVRVHDVLMEMSDRAPLIRRCAIEGDHLVLHVSETTPATRAHFIATRFVSDRAVNASSYALAALRPPQASRLVRNVAHYISGRDIGDEYRYVLERRQSPRRPGMMLEKPSLLLHPWALRTTETSRIEAARGGSYGAPPPPPAMAPMPAMGAARSMRSMAAPSPEPMQREVPGFATIDFLAASAVSLVNQRFDAEGVIRISLASFGADAQRVEVLVTDGNGPPLTAEISLPEAKLRARDLRLRLALDPARHFHEERRIDGVAQGTTLVVPDVRTGKIELVGTLARAHQILTTRLDDATDFKEFAFVTSWPSLDDDTKRAKYSQYACHELNLFLWRKDPSFFEAAIRPSLWQKREKSVVDRFLLAEDLTPFLEPWAFGRLNVLERILVAGSVEKVRVSIARFVGDAVELIPPDPEGDAQLVAMLLGAASLEVEGGAMANAKAAAAPEMDMLMEREAADEDTGSYGQAPMKKMSKGGGRFEAAKDAFSAPGPGSFIGGGGFGGALHADMEERERREIMFRGADKTQEWAEVQWWKRRLEEIDRNLITPNRFWRDLAAYVITNGLKGNSAPFLSPHIGLCRSSFAEAMAALAFLDLPFVSFPPETKLEETRFTLVTKSHALAASTSLVEIEAPANGTSSVLIGQSYVRSDDRWEWQDGEQREKRVTGELIAGVVYRCLVVVTNPTSASERLELLLQIPKGAMPVDSGFITRTMPMSLDPYATESFDYAFYFPIPGPFTHFPAHVTKNGALLAHAPARELTVVREPSTVDHASWSHVSQHGSLDDVIAFLERANLGRTDLDRIAWRMHEAVAFRRITDLLAARHVYDDHLWGYALLHRDARRAGEWLRHQESFLTDSAALDGVLDPAVRGWYQHLEYAPLINARAHQLGAQRRIPNRSLETQYRAFLELTAHRARPSADDCLVAAHYLLSMDRVDDAIPLLERIPEDGIRARLQYDYLTAYVACYRGEVTLARTIAARWVAHPVDRWRNRFVALMQMIDEISSTEKPTIIDPDNRDQQMAEAASQQASLEVTIRGGDIYLTHANLAHCQLRFFKLDIELVFSRQPFVQSDVDRFSFIEPGLTLDVALEGPSTNVPIPASLRGSNIVIQAVSSEKGLRRAVAHYAHDLGVQVAHHFGQLKVVRASTGAPLSAVYVKVYSREHGGNVVFFKDGYTDLRGRFDYATLSTDDLDRTERFALLVASDDAGATITEASPPPR